MSKLEDALRKIEIHNTYDLLKRFAERGKDVAVSYIPTKRQLVSRVSRTSVYSMSHKTDIDAEWYDCGNKTFVGRRAESFPLAIEWATRRYDINEWARGPFGCTIPKAVLDRAKRYVRDAQDCIANQPEEK